MYFTKNINNLKKLTNPEILKKSINPELLKKSINPDLLKKLINPELLKSINPELLKSNNLEILKSIEPGFLKSIDPELLKSIEPELLKKINIYTTFTENLKKKNHLEEEKIKFEKYFSNLNITYIKNKIDNMKYLNFLVNNDINSLDFKTNISYFCKNIINISLLIKNYTTLNIEIKNTNFKQLFLILKQIFDISNKIIASYKDVYRDIITVKIYTKIYFTSQTILNIDNFILYYRYALCADVCDDTDYVSVQFKKDILRQNFSFFNLNNELNNNELNKLSYENKIDKKSNKTSRKLKYILKYFTENTSVYDPIIQKIVGNIVDNKENVVGKNIILENLKLLILQAAMSIIPVIFIKDIYNINVTNRKENKEVSPNNICIYTNIPYVVKSYMNNTDDPAIPHNKTYKVDINFTTGDLIMTIIDNNIT